MAHGLLPPSVASRVLSTPLTKLVAMDHVV